MRINPRLLTASLALLPAQRALAITWEVQAERLVRVNAAVLDSEPVVAPLPDASAVSGFVHMSLLPKVDATVGAKKEKAPSVPVHTVPSIMGTYVLGSPKKLSYGLGVYAGYLPTGAEKLFGLDAKFTQWQLGIVPEVQMNVTPMLTAFAAIGFHMTSASIKGHITDPKSNDTFDSSSQIYLFTAGLKHVPTNAWAGFLVGMKKTTAKFFIDLDGATISTNDKLQDATMPVVVQVSAGWKHKSGFGTALSEIFVPSRLFMPRLSLTYEYLFGAKAATSAPDAAPASAPAVKNAPRKPRNKAAPGTPLAPAAPAAPAASPAPGKQPSPGTKPGKGAPGTPQGTQGGSK